jgi:tripartite ATP-independent transporter DctP family solute receptor
MAVNLMIGVATPPVGMCLFVMSHISKVKLEVLMRAILPFLVPIVAVLLLITYVPQIVMILPDTLMAEKSQRVVSATNADKEEFQSLQKEPAPAPVRSDARLIKVGVTHSQKHSFTQALQNFGRRLERLSHGRFRVMIYYGAQLGSEKVLQEMLTIGTAEMTVTGLLNTYEPLFAVFEMPYLYRDREHIKQVNSGPIMAEVAASLPAKGLRLIGFYENGFRHITNSVRPIEDLGDLAGLKIRTPENQAQIETFKALGADPISMSFSELYSALLLGTVQGQENPLQNIYSARLFEAQKYIAMTGHIYNSAYVLISERFWQSLTESDRKLIHKCVNESSSWQLAYMEKLDVELEQKLKEHGMKFTYPDKEQFRRACEDAYQAIYSRFGPRAKDIVGRIRATK